VTALVVVTNAVAANPNGRHAETKDGSWHAVVSSESAGLYGGMAGCGTPIKKLAKGDVVIIDLEFSGEDGHWFKVETGGAAPATGYARAEDLDVEKPSDVTSWEYKPPPAPPAEGESAPREDRTHTAGRVLVPMTTAEIERDLERFFFSRFGRAAPISALGQTALHARMGFDHSHGVDIALHPDTLEGQALMNHLRGMGIPFIAFRRAVPGSATGAHIHVGIPSRRIERLR
jgi:hypothetical protein